MDTVISFGSHNFTGAHQISFEDNFAANTPAIIPLPGLDGGFSNYGDAKPPTPVGTVRFSLWIHATPSTMVAAKDAIRGLASLGFQDLVMQPSGRTTAANRFCRALMQQPKMTQGVKERSWYLQKVDLRFAVAQPYWQAVASKRSAQTINGTNTFTLTNNGNADAIPHFSFARSGGSGGLTIERRVGASTVDRVQHNTVITAANTPLVIDCEKLSVTLDGNNAYGGNFSFLEPRWFALTPENNTIRVTRGGSLTGTLTISWRDRYR